ncbi:hypothetical protein Fcan01_27474 [Folsomia candida]|uniref:Uncharacterized protein n=1 Tax=Folsomia candida TaxID=158441 RepID=A0A226CWN7_FOLCA|nr:hypothetical protein Fcan01_27474 [Folsomia candida]
MGVPASTSLDKNELGDIISANPSIKIIEENIHQDSSSAPISVSKIQSPELSDHSDSEPISTDHQTSDIKAEIKGTGISETTIGWEKLSPKCNALEWKQRQCISDLLKEAIDQDYSYADFCDSAKLKSLHHGIKWSTLVNLIRKLHNENLRQFTLNELRKKYDPRTAHEICGELTHYCCMQKFGKSSDKHVQGCLKQTVFNEEEFKLIDEKQTPPNLTSPDHDIIRETAYPDKRTDNKIKHATFTPNPKNRPKTFEAKSKTKNLHHSKFFQPT